MECLLDRIARLNALSIEKKLSAERLAVKQSLKKETLASIKMELARILNSRSSQFIDERMPRKTTINYGLSETKVSLQLYNDEEQQEQLAQEITRAIIQLEPRIAEASVKLTTGSYRQLYVTIQATLKDITLSPEEQVMQFIINTPNIF